MFTSQVPLISEGLASSQPAMLVQAEPGRPTTSYQMDAAVQQNTEVIGSPCQHEGGWAVIGYQALSAGCWVKQSQTTCSPGPASLEDAQLCINHGCLQSRAA